MKKTKIYSLAAALFAFALVSANEPVFENPTKKISKQLEGLLSKNDIDVSDNDVTARVLFKLNESGEIELIRIQSEREDLKGLIGDKLAGEKLSVDPVSYDEVYVVEVRVTI
ncbi:hypothetical protein [Croceivirga thetidis]|uniref:Uncharacterized protein n=1 Tax=Croceivirga thetidis TaxID=2721623 RepID=A0ABX1GVB6_9FLAO|nr:hypothetical protein [Croceivirga thetidis]NKI32935.1 hypothetical protein [Croceivirga thetidis]